MSRYLKSQRKVRVNKMCGLFGFSDYSGQSTKGLSDLTNSLAEQSAVRGIDATGIAFSKAGSINICKEIDELTAEMLSAAEALEFERAAALRDRIRELKHKQGKK